jgi:hypothetical protein
MQKLSRIVAAAAVLVYVPAGVVMAQNTPDTGPETATTPPPTTAPSAPAPPAATAPATTEHTTKKKKSAKMTRQQEIDKSIDSGTVPARYRKSVPKEYQQYIPFAK